MNLLDLLQMTKGQPIQQVENSLGPIMQFLAQHRSQPMAPLQMPNLPDHSGMILQAGLQKQAQQDQYAAHLQAKAQMEAQQAAAIAGHEVELSDDPQVQAMLRSGNPQLVAYAMKIAEDEKQKKIASQYNENPTYQKWLNASPEERASMEQFLRSKTPSTNVYTDNVKPPVGYRWGDEAHTAVVPLIGGPADVAAQPLTESQAKAMSNLKVMEETSKQYDEFLKRTKFDPTKMSPKDSFAQGLISIDNPIAEAFGLTPSVEAAGRRMASSESLEYFTIISRWNEIFGREKSGGAIKNPEYRAWLMQYWPGPNDSPEIVAQKTAARRAYEQSQMDVAHPEFRQQAINAIHPVLQQAAQELGMAPDHPALEFANYGLMEEESGGNAKALSPKGARGILQVMPKTQQEMLPGSNPRDMLDQAKAGLLYANKSLQEAGGDVNEAARRYFAGPGGYDNLNASDGHETVRQYGNNVAKRILKHQQAKSIAMSFTKNSPANKDKMAELKNRAAALGW